MLINPKTYVPIAFEVYVHDQVIRIVCDILGVDRIEITHGSQLKSDLGADSIDLVEIEMSIEDACGIKIDDEVWSECITVGHIIDLVETELKK